jgi:hypothetical protein
MKAFATLACSLLSVLALQADEPQRVRMWTPSVAGAQHQVTFAVGIKTERSSSLVDDESKLDQKDYALRVAGVVTEVKVNTKGVATEFQFKLSKVDYLEDGEKKPLFKSGDELVVKQGDDKQVVEVNGEEATEHQAFMVASFLEVPKDGTPTPSELFDADYPVLPGEKWEVNRNKLVLGLQQSGFPLDSTTAKGTVKYVGTSQYQGKPAHSFEVNYSAGAKDFAPPTLPAGVKKVNSTFEGKIIGVTSVKDPNEYGQSKQVHSWAMEFDVELSVGGEKKEFKTSQSTKIALQADWEPVK